MPDALPRRKVEADVPRPSNVDRDERPVAVVKRLSEVEEEKIRWLWPFRLAYGKFNILDGDPGEGKSLLTVDFAARVTTGRPLPGFTSASPPASVVFLAAEDGIADTIKPRFTAAGGDPDLVHVMTGTRIGNRDGHPSLTRDVVALGSLVRDVNAGLVIVDPLTAYMPGVDTHKDGDVRTALSPLVTMAGETGACILAVRHLSKAEARAALYRGGGSIAFIGMARGALLLARHPDDRTRRVVALSKANLAGEAASWAFSVAVDERSRPFISWETRPSELTAEDLVRGMDMRGKAVGIDTAVGTAEAFLRAALAEGPRLSREIEEEAREAHGITSRTLDRARAALGIVARPQVVLEPNGRQRRVWAQSLPTGEERQERHERQENCPRQSDVLDPNRKDAKCPESDAAAPLAPMASLLGGRAASCEAASPIPEADSLL